ncbi:MAG: putative bifunctional diguanylate cyclase/phosphodiesterase, partial [Hyphomonadaceae bacterium]
MKTSRKKTRRSVKAKKRRPPSRGLQSASRAAAAARKAEERLRAAIDALPEGVVFLDPEHRYILWNQRYAEIYKKSADLFAPGARLEDTLRVGVARGDYPEAAGREEEWMHERVAKLDNPSGQHEQRLADGRWILIEERKMPDGCTIGLRVDVTEIKKKEESFRLLFEGNPVPMFLFDAETRCIRKANAAACAHYGYAADELVGRHVGMLDHPDGRGTDRHESVATHRRADGGAIDVTTFSSDLNHDGRPSVLLACIDVTERRRSEARLAHMARHDALTNLPNRVLYREQVEVRLARSTPETGGFAVLLFDLDNFKGVNDTLGHSMGDMLLQQTARRIETCLGPSDLAARLGGDEFAVIHAGPNARETLTPLVERIVAELKRPFVLENQVVQIGASVGVALAPDHGDDPDRLLKSADLALYAAKAQGRGAYCFFEPEMDAHLQARRKLEIELRAAIIAGDLEVYYQPLMDIATGRMSGCEALLRWRHPERGFIPPSEFVPIAEDCGLIGVLGQFVLHRACADAATWPDDIKVAINLSPAQFRTTAILDTVVH